MLGVADSDFTTAQFRPLPIDFDGPGIFGLA